MLKKIITSLENTKIPLTTWLASFFSIILIRVGLESFSAKQGDLFTLTSFSHLYFFFISAILSLVLIIYLYTKEDIIKISRLALYGWFISLTPPIIDLLVSKGKGGLIISYLFTEPAKLFQDYYTFFGSDLENGMTYGIRFQTVLACVLVASYVYYKTKKPLKTILSALTVYTTIFFFAILPTLLTILEKLSFNITRKDIIDFAFLPQTIFKISLINPAKLFDFKLSLTLIVIIVLQLTIFFWIYNKEKFKSVLKNARYSRFILNITALAAGIYIATRIFNTPFSPSPFEIITLLNVLFITSFIWLYSVGINDIADQEIDKISNPNRPLIKKEITLQETKNLNLIFALLANSIAFTISLPLLTLSLLLTGLTYIYSTKPLRLKRYPFISSFVIALSILISIFMTFILFADNQSLKFFPGKITLTTLLLFTLITNVKDIKDEKGDGANDVLSIPVLFGEQKGKKILAILNVISFIIFAALLSTNAALMFISVCFAALAYFLTYDKNSKELYLFILYALFFAIVVVFAY